MSQVQESIDVEVPVRVAYDQWTQVETFPHFIGGVESISQMDDTHNHWVTKIGGVEREFDTEITGQIPDEGIAWHSIGGDVEHGGVVTFHRLGVETTRVMIQIDWNPQGVAETAGALLGIDEHRVKADAKRFKAFVEGNGRQTGAWRGEV